VSFDDRWRELARASRDAEHASLSLADIARLARKREPDPIPFVTPRVGAALALAAAVLTLFVAPIALDDARPLTQFAKSPAPLPKPPALPPPPSLESPSYYVAAASAAWKDLQP